MNEPQESPIVGESQTQEGATPQPQANVAAPVFDEIRPGLYTEQRNGVDIWVDPAAMLRAVGQEPTQEACAAVFAGIARAYAMNGITAILVQNPDLENIGQVVARMRQEVQS